MPDRSSKSSPDEGAATGYRPGGQLRLRVTAAAESILRSGHPWLFAGSIREQSRPGRLGELAVVYDRKDRFLAVGLFDPDSAIRLRVLHSGKPRPVDGSLWMERLETARRKRAGLFDSQTTGFRWINGESDGWPGLVLDRYDTTLVLKLYSAAWLPWLEAVCKVLTGQLKPERVVLRLSRNIQAEAAARFGKADGQILAGSPLESPVIFLETGLRFESDVIRGQKTGFFLDQRENRRMVEGLARGRTLLNVFSFSGGFSLYAARGSGLSVTDLDISAHALAAADRNFKLNQSEPAVRGCRRERVQADAFQWLAKPSERYFDLIVLDPPSLAKRETERSGAVLAYFKLASLGIARLAPKGVLLACSCSAHVSAEDFYEAVCRASVKSKRRFTELSRSGQPSDHPAAFEEAKYLKAICLELE
jgi:23S rRNA (cytosine1962-C5)-methyltransferase